MNASSIPNDKDNPQEADVVALLREAGEAKRAMGRELARRLTAPLGGE